MVPVNWTVPTKLNQTWLRGCKVTYASLLAQEQESSDEKGDE